MLFIYWFIVIICVIMEPCSPLINFTGSGDDGSLESFHDSPLTPQNVERSLLDDDTDLEQPFLGVPLIGSGNQADDLTIFSQAIDSLKCICGHCSLAEKMV